MRAAIYIRVSTKLQEDRYSLSAQKLELTRYAESQGWTIVDTFKDVDSGGKLHKHGLEALLDCVDDGKVDVVLCVDQDRLSRLDTIDWEYLKQALRENGVKIAEPGNIVDLTNEDDEFISDIKNLIAKREKRAIVRRMTRGLRQYTREGKVWGKQPEEYIYNPKTKEIEINPKYSWIIPYIDKLYLEERMGLERIAKQLYKLTPTSNGRKWTGIQIRNKLINPCYHGVLQKKFSNGETVEIEDVYPPLRTKETYEKIQVALKSRHLKYPTSDFHFLRDIEIRCADCGHILSIRKGSKHGDSSKYYLRHAVEAVDKCPSSPSVNTKRIETPLIKAVKELTLGSDIAKKYIKSDFSDNDKKLLEKEIKRLKKSIADKNSKIDRLLDLYLDGSWSKEKLDSAKKKLESEIAELARIFDEQNRKFELIQKEQLNYDAVVQNLVLVERMEVLTDEEDRQEVFGVLFPTATYHDTEEELVLHMRLPEEDVHIDVTIKIDPPNLDRENELREIAKERYDKTQELINQNKWINFKQLTRLSEYNAKTLRKDEEMFGPYQYLMPAKGSSELTEYKKQQIKEYIIENGKQSITKIAKALGYSRKTVSALLRDLN